MISSELIMERIGKYEIIGELGKGGMGIIYKARDPHIGRIVAIKTIRTETFSEASGLQDARKRFLREAQAAGNLSHPNIVTIFEVGEDQGLIYIVMEYIEGTTLAEKIATGRKWSVAEVAALLEQVAAALDYAHHKGIVHRDVKPANILIDAQNRARIVDFGIAHVADSAMTHSGMLLGTPRYMSPEQVAGKKVDNRSDIFSLGAIAYELLANQCPFNGDSVTTVIYKIINEKVPPLQKFNSDLSPGVDRVVHKALEKKPEMRYESCSQFVSNLETCLAGQPLAKEHLSGEQAGQLFSKSLRAWLYPLGIIIVVLCVLLIVSLSGKKKSSSFPSSGSVPDAAGDSAVVQTKGAERNIANITTSVKALNVQEKKPEKAGNNAGEKIGSAGQSASSILTKAQRVSHNAKGFSEAQFFNDTVMVQIPAGDFTVGSPIGSGNEDENPPHRVYISEFWLGKYEVTFAQYDRFCQDTGRELPGDSGWGRGNRPVINVSWLDAEVYCRWLSAKTGLNFRLPSEAEWEKAARYSYPWGEEQPDGRHANIRNIHDGYNFTAPVGSFLLGASSYGILDMAGNVWEWISDWYDAKSYKDVQSKDPRGPQTGEYRCVRGGCWQDGPDYVRSANRGSEDPKKRLPVIGFRLALAEL